MSYEVEKNPEVGRKFDKGGYAMSYEVEKNPEVGSKFDKGKQPWFALPLEILEPLADVMAFGECKYGTFNCLERFDDPDRRFWDASMRHAAACQRDPLAIDEETGCYHEASRAFSALMRLYHCRKLKEQENKLK